MAFEHMTKEEIEAAIDLICEQMKGPLPPVERACLHAERKDLRDELESRTLGQDSAE